VPDFLTGRKAKTKKYKDDYYTILFNHFKNNLDKSRALIVIGYGFKDTVINDLLIKHFDFTQKPVVIIDTKKPELIHELNDNSKVLCSSVVDVNYEKDILHDFRLN
jgi:homospermidine synthase